MKYRFKHVVEYGSVKFLYGLMNVLPAGLAMRLGAGLSAVAHTLARKRVREAHRRIREVFGDQFKDGEVRRIARLSMRNVFLNGVELMRIGKIDRAWVERHFKGYEKLAVIRPFIEKGTGVIIVVPHTGNWDLSGVAANLLGYPIFFIVGNQKNPLTDAFMNRLRGITGIETIARDSGMLKKTIKYLRGGRILAFMTDLRSKTPAMKVRFFGKEANVVGGLGLFARQALAPVLPVVPLRNGLDQHEWIFADPILPDPSLDKEIDWQRMTQAVMDFYDGQIRRHPEQYFWYNKRWVLDPLEEPAATTPPPAGQV